MAEKKETKQRPLKKGDFVRIAMEVMMKQHEPKTKEELQVLKALEKEVEGLEVISFRATCSRSIPRWPC